MMVGTGPSSSRARVADSALWGSSELGRDQHRSNADDEHAGHDAEVADRTRPPAGAHGATILAERSHHQTSDHEQGADWDEQITEVQRCRSRGGQGWGNVCREMQGTPLHL